MAFHHMKTVSLFLSFPILVSSQVRNALTNFRSLKILIKFQQVTQTLMVKHYQKEGISSLSFQHPIHTHNFHPIIHRITTLTTTITIRLTPQPMGIIMVGAT
jgi:hypothetical protein